MGIESFEGPLDDTDNEVYRLLNVGGWFDRGEFLCLSDGVVGLLVLPSEVRDMVAVELRRVAAVCDATPIEHIGSNDDACAALTVLARAG